MNKNRENKTADEKFEEWKEKATSKEIFDALNSDKQSEIHSSFAEQVAEDGTIEENIERGPRVFGQVIMDKWDGFLKDWDFSDVENNDRDEPFVDDEIEAADLNEGGGDQ